MQLGQNMSKSVFDRHQPKLTDNPAADLKEHIDRQLGSRAASFQRERQNERTVRRLTVSKARVDPRDKARNAVRAVMGSL